MSCFDMRRVLRVEARRGTALCSDRGEVSYAVVVFTPLSFFRRCLLLMMPARYTRHVFRAPPGAAGYARAGAQEQMLLTPFALDVGPAPMRVA